jgi:hypothetical protein
VSEIIFVVVEEAAEDGQAARALGTSIFSEAHTRADVDACRVVRAAIGRDTLPNLHDDIRDAVRCHFEDGHAPKVVRLHFVREQLLAL